MSDCQNCYNGCTEIVSDRCVKYTGIAIPSLGIQTGDTLSFVEQALVTFLLSALNGTGIKIDVSSIDICLLVQKYLPTCGDFTIVDISKALIQAACDLQEQVDVIDSTLVTLNADYTIGCLTGVTASSDTHAIVQAVITKLCTVEVDLVALALDLETNYVRLDELDALIQAYLTSQGTGTKYYNRMIPYAVVEYYGPISGNFDGTGAGLVSGLWEKIFLCNGRNGTPDKRGVVGVGVTDGTMLGLTMDPKVIPSSGNPTYSQNATIVGSNGVTLNGTQIPSHTHVGGANTTGAHTHNTQYGANGSGTLYAETPYISDVVAGVAGLTTSNGSHTHVITIEPFGGGLSHANFQPGLGCYYIQYRP
jgi:hypothetical protein